MSNTWYAILERNNVEENQKGEKKKNIGRRCVSEDMGKSRRRNKEQF